MPGGELFDHLAGAGRGRGQDHRASSGYPNRDSLPYTEYYGIDPSDTMFRGTLRYPGWCATMKQIARLGWLGTDALDGLDGQSFADLTARLAGVESTAGLAGGGRPKLGLDPAGPEISCMEWLGLFSDDPLPRAASPVDILTARMLEKMSYAEGERDMLVLQHTFIARFPDRRERITSTMVDFGIPGGDSSMNRTVGLPAAVGVRFILEGRFTKPGVIVPVMPEFYEPALEELQRLGIQFIGAHRGHRVVEGPGSQERVLGELRPEAAARAPLPLPLPRPLPDSGARAGVSYLSPFRLSDSAPRRVSAVGRPVGAVRAWRFQSSPRRLRLGGPRTG